MTEIVSVAPAVLVGGLAWLGGRVRLAALVVVTVEGLLHRVGSATHLFLYLLLAAVHRGGCGADGRRPGATTVAAAAAGMARQPGAAVATAGAAFCVVETAGLHRVVVTGA